MQKAPLESDVLRYAACAVSIVFLYYILAQVGLLLATPPAYSAVIWLPSGLALAAIFMYGYRFIPVIFIAALVSNGAATDAVSYTVESGLIIDRGLLLVRLAMAIGPALQAWVAVAMLLKFYGKDLNICGWRHLAVGVIFIIPASCMIAASCGILTLHISEILPMSDVPSSWVRWWCGDMFGMLFVFPAIILSVFNKSSFKWHGNDVTKIGKFTSLLILVSLGMTVYVSMLFSKYNYQRNLASFTAAAMESENALRTRISSYEQALRASKAYFLGSKEVSADEWTVYVKNLDIGHSYPGIHGIGWINDLGQKDIESYEQEISARSSAKFQVHPQGHYKENFIITYIEPFASNQQSVGLNIALEENSYHAAVYARDSGQPALTKNVSLVQDEAGSAEFLYFMPVYELEERETQKEFRGWVYAPLVAKDFLKEMTLAQGRDFHLAVYDGNVADENLIYRSDTLTNIKRNPFYTITRAIEIQQQKWLLVMTSTPRFEESTATFEVYLIAVGGVAFTILLSAFFILLERRTQLIQKMVEDKTNEIVRKSEELQLIFDSVPVRIWYKDDKNTILKLNQQAACSMGGRVADFEGKNIAEFFPTMAEKYLKDDLDVINSGKPLLGIVEKYTPSEGVSGWVKTDKAPFYDKASKQRNVLVVAQDITTQMSVEDSLRKSEELNSLVLKGMGIGIWDWDMVQNKIYCSQKLREIMGLENYGLVVDFSEYESMIHTDDRDAVMAAIAAHCRGAAPYDIEYRLLPTPEKEYWIRVSGQVQWNDEGRPIRMVGSLADITEKKYAEEQLVRSNLELERFAYIASHDLQEPARIVSNFSQLMEEEGENKLDADMKEYLGFIRKSSVRMQEMIEDLLEYSRASQTAQQFEDVDIRLLIGEVIEMLEVNIQNAGARVTYDDLPVIHVGRVRFLRLLQNLVGNGIKYRKPDVSPEIHIVAEDMGDEWLFTVSDNGIGVKEEYLEQIFVLFKRLHSAGEYEGTGIGLAVCKKIVEGFGGRIWATSTYGEGTDMHFTVPKPEGTS